MKELAALAVAVLCLMAVCIACLIFASCATPAVTVGNTTNTGDGSVDRCTGLLALACARDQRCGGGQATDCIAAIGHMCVGTYGLTQAEADNCAIALGDQLCDTDFPPECTDIMYGPDRSASTMSSDVITL